MSSSKLDIENTVNRITVTNNDKKSILLKEDLFSRIINQSSNSRHFVSWSEQEFILSDHDIAIVDKDGKEFSAKLDSAYIKSNHYLPVKDRINKNKINDLNIPVLCLYISQYYHEKKVYIETEINIQFTTIDQQNKWKDAIINTIALCNSKLDSISKVGIDYFAEKLMQDDEQLQVCNDNGLHCFRKLNMNTQFQNLRKYENTHSKVMIQKKVGLGFHLPLPKLNIVILVVGTRGDVQPFVSIGKRLRDDGHRVRIATHETYRKFITIDNGFEFYPLAGDPLKLSEFMVRNEGRLIPTSKAQMAEFPECLQTTVEIMKSCLGACTSPDPLDPSGKQFIAHAIISNPVSNGHFHCADALGIPLHMMFPQPWTPTKAFPHPLTNLSYETMWDAKNRLSYNSLDKLVWMSMKLHINEFRSQSLGIPRFRTGQGGAFVLNSRKVPFVKMWSPHLVPKPKDWPSYVDVVGNFNEEVIDSEKDIEDDSPIDANGKQQVIPDPAYSAPLELIKFLEDGPPIFIGFGSMVLGSMEDFLRLMLSGACIAGVKVCIQMGWSDCTPELFQSIGKEVEAKWGAGSIGGLSKWEASKQSLMIGPCPHSWLFRYVSAVVHHGGAGTTAAGIRAGKPTLVCYLFGDQPFWGEAIRRNEIGPASHRLSTLTPKILASRLKDLISNKYKINASKMRSLVLTDDGIGKAVDAFYRNLPIDEMVCDVSIYMGESKLANYYCRDCCLKLSGDICDIIHSDPDLKNHTIVPAIYVNWDQGPTTFQGGIYEGFIGLNHDLMAGVGSFFVEPAKGTQTEEKKITGLLKGTALGIFKLCASPFTGLYQMGKKIRHGLRGGDGSDLVPPNMKPVRLDQQLEDMARRISEKPKANASSSSSSSNDNDNTKVDEMNSNGGLEDDYDNNEINTNRKYGSYYIPTIYFDKIQNSDSQAYIDELSSAYANAIRSSYTLNQLTKESRYMSLDTFYKLVLDTNFPSESNNSNNIDRDTLLTALMGSIGQTDKYISRVELSLFMNRRRIKWLNPPLKYVNIEKKIIADVS